MQDSGSRKPGRLWSGPEPGQNRCQCSAHCLSIHHPRWFAPRDSAQPPTRPIHHTGDMYTLRQRESPFPEQGELYRMGSELEHTGPATLSFSGHTRAEKPTATKTAYSLYTNKDSSECEGSSHWRWMTSTREFTEHSTSFVFSLQVQSSQCFLLLHDITTEDTHLQPVSCLFPPSVSAVLTFLLHAVGAVTLSKLLRAVFRMPWHRLPGPRQGVNSQVT